MDTMLLGLILILVTLIAAFLFVRYQRLYNDMFRDKAGRVVGSVQVHNSYSTQTSLTVRTFGKEAPPDWIGLEVAFPNRRLWPVQLKLSRDEAAELVGLLSNASASA